MFSIQILFQQILTLSEGVTDTVFHQVSTKRMDVISFVQHFEEKTKEMHLDELEDDHFCKHVVPRLQVWNGILNHAVYVYTSKIFNFFEMELLGCMGVRMKEVCKDGEVCIYEAIEEAQQKVCKINYNLSTQDIHVLVNYLREWGFCVAMHQRHLISIISLRYQCSTY